jgi:disulfide bond formation protein DsbB
MPGARRLDADRIPAGNLPDNGAFQSAMASMLPAFLDRLTPRQVFAAVAAACFGLIGFGLVLQHQVGLEPCPMCILQRYAFVSMGVVALIAALHGPVGLGVRVYGALLGALAIAGGSVSVRQSLLQRFPKPELAANCGADLDFLLGNFPLAQALPRIFAGTGDCAKVEWSLFGLSIAEWALLWFAILLATTAWVAFLRRPNAA